MEKIAVNGILIRLIVLLSEETGIPIEQINLKTKLDALVSDSLEFVSLIVEVRDRFHSDIPNAVIGDLQTVEDLYGAIHDYLPARKAS